MKQIYDKINNHQYLNYYDIAKFMYIKTKGQVKTKFLKTEHDMVASIDDNYLEVRIDYKTYKLKYFRKFYKDKLGLEFEDENSSFLVDIYNLILLFEVFHELIHFKQVSLIDKNQTFKAKLLNDSYKFCRILPKMYFKNHDLYYVEYDATIRAFILTLDIIENKCTNLNTNAIIEFNRFITMIIYHSYGHKYSYDNVSKIYDKFTSPVSYSKFLFDIFNNKYEKEKFWFCIKNMEKRSRTEYMRLLNGLDISDTTDKLLYDFCMDNYSTENILNDIKKRTKRKFKIR